MTAARIKDIRDNIAYADDAWRELSDLVAEAQRADNQVKHIGQKAGAVLQAARECFDYCAADLRDDFLAKNVSAYFPFHPDSLSKGKPFHDLRSIEPRLYDALLSLSERIRDRKVIPSTLALYSDAAAINSLVNSKKHHAVIETIETTDQCTLMDFPDGGVVVARAWPGIGPDGVPRPPANFKTKPEHWHTSPGVKVTSAKSFSLKEGLGASRSDIYASCRRLNSSVGR